MSKRGIAHHADPAYDHRLNYALLYLVAENDSHLLDSTVRVLVHSKDIIIIIEYAPSRSHLQGEALFVGSQTALQLIRYTYNLDDDHLMPPFGLLTANARHPSAGAPYDSPSSG